MTLAKNLLVFSVFTMLFLGGFYSCSEEKSENQVSTNEEKSNESGNDLASKQKAAAEKVLESHKGMFDAVLKYLNDSGYYKDGSWDKHFGDGNLFAPTFDLVYWKLKKDQPSYKRAVEILNQNKILVDQAAADLNGNLGNLENISMALLALVECGAYLDAETAKPFKESADNLIKKLDGLAKVFKNYIQTDAGEFAAGTYGPTSLSAFFAALHLEFAYSYPETEKELHLKRADEIMTAVYDKVWDEEMGIFRFAPDDKRVMLYPNSTMMLAYGRAYAITKEQKYLDRFEETYKGIQQLKDKAGDHYHSPYSAEEMKATDEDYATLSSQNYLMMAFLAAYQVTGKDVYLDEIDKMLTWVRTKLLNEKGEILHHWVNGRWATDEDPWVYCLGCNFQTLYILSAIEYELIEKNK